MPMDKLTYLGKRVHDARKDCKLTQQELSDQTGVSVKMIQGIEILVSIHVPQIVLLGQCLCFLLEFPPCQRLHQQYIQPHIREIDAHIALCLGWII